MRTLAFALVFLLAGSSTLGTPGDGRAINLLPNDEYISLLAARQRGFVKADSLDTDGLENELFHCEPVGVCQRCTENEMMQDPNLLPAFQPCDQVKSVSRWAFFRFQFLNVFLSVLACMTLIWRRRILKVQKYRRLNHRMGRA
ncbi:hypothetical protein IWQ62_003647 [Dispira parvispora]|uniref:Uncharacterized protein n=1 Tax=Dispira parvispora TaxID=1520584 RepID=A0A9W8E1F8_9FUNG|nr:hypothetical protein IWQ62_003647 [Dispira parvispora]